MHFVVMDHRGRAHPPSLNVHSQKTDRRTPMRNEGEREREKEREGGVMSKEGEWQRGGRATGESPLLLNSLTALTPTMVSSGVHQ